MLSVITPGPQTTLQGAPRNGYRHFGIPAAGAADTLSRALANRLVGNALGAAALEITYGGFQAGVRGPCAVAVTGAAQDVLISGMQAPVHETLYLAAGDTIEVPPATAGMRSYLAVAGGFQATEVFGSVATYLPARMGGFEGRALQGGDDVARAKTASAPPQLRTPGACRPAISASYALRACASAETGLLSPPAAEALFSEAFTVGRQVTRMGAGLDGPRLEISSDGMMRSAPVFPGTVQCPESGAPIILMCDAQTTGGYPRIAHIARCDRHLLGQLRPGNRIRLLHRTPADATRDHTAKLALLQNWLGQDFVLE